MMTNIAERAPEHGNHENLAVGCQRREAHSNCGADPIAVQNCYGRSRFEGYLGNVGLDDKSDIRTAIAIYEKLITEERIDLVLGPYGSRMTDPVRRKTFPMTAQFG